MLNGYCQKMPFFALKVPTKGNIMPSNISTARVNTPTIIEAKMMLHMV